MPETDDLSSPPDVAGPPEATGPPQELLVRKRRHAPRYSRFIGAGLLVGVVVAGLITFAAPVEPDSDYSLRSVLGYTSAVLGLLGGLAGGFAAVLLDRR